ncbi:MAG: hypothetical protein FJ109_02130 [Deltaproteobacteria bacterium]|nr:hypothetical protein [Deltaproteobacteria bacterium]
MSWLKPLTVLAVAVQLSFLVHGCIVQTDLSPLTFLPPQEEDATPEDAGGTEPEDDFDSCPGFYRCIVSRSVQGEAFSECKDLVPPDEKTSWTAVEGCRTKMCAAADLMPGSDDFDGDALIDCLFQKCHQELVACAAGGGDEPCSEFAGLWEENHADEDDCGYDFAQRLCLLDYLEGTAGDQVDTVGKFLSCTATKAVTPGFEEDCSLHCKAGE